MPDTCISMASQEIPDKGMEIILFLLFSQIPLFNRGYFNIYYTFFTSYPII